MEKEEKTLTEQEVERIAWRFESSKEVKQLCDSHKRLQRRLNELIKKLNIKGDFNDD